jgi:hypothetical protein
MLKMLPEGPVLARWFGITAPQPPLGRVSGSGPLGNTPLLHSLQLFHDSASSSGPVPQLVRLLLRVNQVDRPVVGQLG